MMIGDWLKRALATTVALVLATQAISAERGRVLSAGRLPDDKRLGALKDLDGHFPFDVPKSLTAWELRAEELRRRVLVANGLWPLPPRTPLNPVVHGRVERKGFYVQKVYFESIPGHFVTGLLFRPTGKSGKLPAVLCPHGHGGRLQDYGEQETLQLITQGAERFADCGRYPKLSRCAQLARMGCVTFIFDMLGYADSQQVSRQLAHRFAVQRPELDQPDRWGFYSTQAELRLQSIMGLQVWNCVRALDFLAGLPDVDANRIGVTGGSGGGTQTILLGAIDQRPVAAFPQGMVSTSMQGGCTCENCCLLRVGTGNVELAALFAPRPQAMTAANDWTKAMMSDGYPQLQELYALYGKRDSVQCTSLTHFRHNYNYVTRAQMYAWFNEHLQLGLDEPIVEEHWQPLTPAEWTIWDDQHPAPAGGLEHELALIRWMTETSDNQLQQLTGPEYEEIVGGAIRTMIGQPMPSAASIAREKVDKQDRGQYLFFKDLLRLSKPGAELPVLSYYPQHVAWNGQVVIWVDGSGKSATLTEDGDPIGAINDLLAAGYSVLSADLIGQGEFVGEAPSKQSRVVDNPREFAGFTFGYNHTLFAQRVHDVMALIAFVAGDEHQATGVHLVGVGGAAPIVAAARTQAGELVKGMVVDTAGFRFAGLRSYRDPNFWPGAVKYGDLPGLLALAAPHPVWITGEPELPSVVRKVYQGNGAAVLVSTLEQAIQAMQAMP